MDVRFERAKKEQLKLRMAIAGPSGSGKTYTGLIAARAFAGKSGKVAVIDTQNGQAKLYADEFNFDTIIMDDDFGSAGRKGFHPRNFIDLITLAENEGYDVIVIDSLTHAWNGPGGVLSIVDLEATRAKSSFNAWAVGSKIHAELIAAILSSKCHIICTLRSKMAYAQEYDEKTGKTKVRKLGTEPIQREGTEYEFDFICDIDINHIMSMSKSRCKSLSDRIIDKPQDDFFLEMKQWLDSGEAQQKPKKETKTNHPPTPHKHDAKPTTQDIISEQEENELESALTECFPTIMEEDNGKSPMPFSMNHEQYEYLKKLCKYKIYDETIDGFTYRIPGKDKYISQSDAEMLVTKVFNRIKGIE